jgi:hypothetical protein
MKNYANASYRSKDNTLFGKCNRPVSKLIIDRGRVLSSILDKRSTTAMFTSNASLRSSFSTKVDSVAASF